MRTAFACLVVTGLLLSCSRPPELVHHHLAAFGTEVTITLLADGEAGQTLARVDRELQRMHRDWHAWEPGRLGQINQAIAEGRCVDLPEDVATVIEQTRELERRSQGLFNPAIGRLLTLWGFHSSELPMGPPPTEAEIAELVSRSPSMRQLHIGHGRLCSDNRAVQLDFGGYIKGVAVERALKLLAASGLRHAIVNAGGDLGVIGQRGQRPWRAAVQHPDGHSGHHVAMLEVHAGEFLFTSGNYRRYRQGDGIRHGHIIDPRDGYPADAVSSVSLIAEDGGLADAAATALAVANAGEWLGIADALGIDKVMRITADGSVELTPQMAARAQWREPPDRIHLISTRERGRRDKAAARAIHVN